MHTAHLGLQSKQKSTGDQGWQLLFVLFQKAGPSEECVATWLWRRWRPRSSQNLLCPRWMDKKEEEVYSHSSKWSFPIWLLPSHFKKRTFMSGQTAEPTSRLHMDEKVEPDSFFWPHWTDTWITDKLSLQLPWRTGVMVNWAHVI